MKEINQKPIAKKTTKTYKVVKHNSLVMLKSEEAFTITQQKLVCHLVANIKPKDDDFALKKVNIKDLDFVNDGTKNHAWFRKEFLKLLKMPFQIPGDGGYANWFSYLKYKDGFIEYSFDPRLKPFLLNLKSNFTMYNLDNVLRLKTNYAIQTYELLMKNKGMKSFEMTIEDFKEYLHFPKSYQNGELKRFLVKIQEEIKENTTLQFDFTFKKNGHSFSEILFKTKNNKKIKDVSYEGNKATIELLKNGKQQEMFKEEIVVAAIETKVEDTNKSLKDKLKNLRLINDRQ